MTITMMFTRPHLTDVGFEGWITFDALRSTDPCPEVGGVYVVARDEASVPSFLATSCGGWFKDRDPTVSLDEVHANWVEGAEIVYIGKANNIRRRLKEFAKFGAGHRIGHWGGRLIWQLEESSRLLVAWKPTPGIDPLVYEAQLLAEFRAEYGKPPFANDPHRLGG